MELKRVTVEDVLDWDPCWVEEDEGDGSRVRRVLAPLGESFTAIDILGLSGVSPEDRLWVVLRPEMLGDRVLRLFGVACARSALLSSGHDDPRSARACDIAEAYALGEATREDLQAAWSAAESAAESAAWSAVWSAARSAAWSAARSAQVDALLEYLSLFSPDGVP